MSKEAIWNLLAKKLSGEASEEELSELEHWLRQDPDLHYEADHVTGLWNQQPHSKQGSHAWEDHLTRMKQKGLEDFEEPGDEEAPQIPFFRKSVVWVSMAAMLLLLAGGWWLIARQEPPWQMAAALPEEEVVATKRGTRSRIALPDGSVVWLNADSKLIYDHSFNKKNREVKLEGEGYFDVRPDKEKPFIIHTASMDVKVLGTVFNVRSYPGDAFAETALVRGSVEVDVRNAGMKPVILKPNEKLVVKAQMQAGKEIQPEETEEEAEKSILVQPLQYTKKDSIRMETAWVSNILIFEDESFRDLAKRMERWYAVNIVFENEATANIHLTGKFERESVTQALDAMKITADFDYAFEGARIVIR